jgi:hypothetical protein
MNNDSGCLQAKSDSVEKKPKKKINSLKTDINLNYSQSPSSYVPQRENIVTIIKISRLVLFSEVMAACCENHANHIDTQTMWVIYEVS